MINKSIFKLRKRTVESVKNNKNLLRNFSYLTALQIINLLIPLITYPYLIRVLGKDAYGLVSYAYAIIGYFGILISFGFDISAVKDISINRYNKKKISEITSTVIFIKGLLFLVSFLILVLIVNLLPQAKEYKILFYIVMISSINIVLYPSWYFQGIEDMKYITYLNVFSRIISVPLIFIFIKSSSNYLLLPIINGIGAILAGLVSLYIIFFNHHLKFIYPSNDKMKIYLKESLPIFISNISSKIYVNANKVIVGTFLGMEEVAYYDLGEKVTSILKIPQNILSQTIFPKISKDKNILFIKKSFIFSILFNIILVVLTIIFSKYIVILLGGKEMIKAIPVIAILTLSVPIIAMSNIFGIQILIPFGKSKLFSLVVFSSFLVYMFQILICWLVWDINIYSLSILTVTTEVFVTTIMYYLCKKLKLW